MVILSGSLKADFTVLVFLTTFIAEIDALARRRTPAPPTSVAPIVQQPLDPDTLCLNNHRCEGDLDPSVALTCKCDVECKFFGDCCPGVYFPTPLSSVAKPGPVVTRSKPERDAFECTPDNYFVVSKCPRRARDAVIADLCHRTSPSDDPYMQVPVTDTTHNITYKNYYCAICNGITFEDLVFWDIEVRCAGVDEATSRKKDFLDELVYNSEANSWGLWLYHDRLYFESCIIGSIQPQRLKALYSPRSCFSEIVDYCPFEWRDTDVAEQCHVLYAPVFRERNFKNVYCAICHEESLENLNCNPLVNRLAYGVKTAPVPSFSILLDMNQDANNRVGKILHCGEGQVTFSGKCRSLTCGFPGYVLQDGKCIKEDEE